MVPIKEAGGPDVYQKHNGAKKIFIGKLFGEDEEERATCIAKALNGMTVQEATDLLERFKVYLLQSIFSPEI